MPKIPFSGRESEAKGGGGTDSPASIDWLKAYRFHGLSLSHREGAGQAVGECPFCGREAKWFVSLETGQWQCKVCSASGNLISFLRQLWVLGDKATSSYDQLATDRKLCFPESLMHWGIIRSPITNDWLVPGYGVDGKIVQLYQYNKLYAGGRFLLLPTPGVVHGLMGISQYHREKGTIYVTEGPWDGIALWELLRMSKKTEEGSLTFTGSENASLLSDSCVLAVPSCSVFSKAWLPLFSGKKVVLLYDNDHPIKNAKTGLMVPPAGTEGMKRVAGLLTTSSEGSPKELHYLNWGDMGYDPSLPTGYDVRDHVSAGSLPASRRIPLVAILLDKVSPVPVEWLPTGKSSKKKTDGSLGNIEALPCSTWSELSLAWRKAMKWTKGLDQALSVMLACVTSTKAVGDQLWVKIVSPPSTGKSTLAEALSINRKYIYPKDTMTGLLSGYQVDRQGAENQSMVEKLRDKTLIIKDADTVLNEPNLGKILAQFRAFYDRSIRSQYGNMMSRNHEGINTTVILLGTSSLRRLDKSELGERFLDCTIMENIDDEEEDDILWRVVNRADMAMDYISDGKVESQQTLEMVKAMQLSGGYVEYLRLNAAQLLREISFPDEMKRKCLYLGKFVAYMRARPSERQEEIAEREFAARLVSQIARLAKCLAVVLNRKEVDEEVMNRTKRVAFDTARGRTLQLVKHLAEAKTTGHSVASLAILTNQTEDKERAFLRFLRKIGAVECYTLQNKTGIGSKVRWRLTERLTKLYKEVMKDAKDT